MKKKTIAYIGPFLFPYGQAASKRVLGNIILLQDLGFEVIVGHGGDIKESEFHNDETNIKCYGLGELFSGSKKIARVFNLLFRGGNNTLAWLEGLDEKPDYVIVYGGYHKYAKSILTYCKRNNIKIIFDIVEWYEPSQMIGGKYGFFYRSFLKAFENVYPQADGVIVIGSNLKEVFCNSKVVVIPPLVSTTSTNTPSVNNGVLSLIYAGNIGNKDNLLQIIRVVDKLSSDYKIKLDVFGPTREEIELKYNINIVNESINIHGKIKQEEINSFISRADFTIFTRPDTHCNKYGFPSKFVESLSLGVPVATNLTSDIGLYLKDEYNGFIISDCSENAIDTTIRKMLMLSQAQKITMKENAFRTAEEHFSSRSLLLRENVSNFFNSFS